MERCFKSFACQVLWYIGEELINFLPTFGLECKQIQQYSISLLVLQQLRFLSDLQPLYNL